MRSDRIAERAARLRLKGDEAPMRFTLVGAILGAGFGAVFNRDAPLWVMAVMGAGGGLAGWFFGCWRRRHFRKQEQHVLAMLETVERHADGPR